jgi:hypothetical protein
MKISKKELKELIKEEFEKVRTADVRSSAVQGVKDKVAGGVTDQERGIIQRLQQQLTKAAQVGNIASGKVLRLAQMLSQELAKVAPEQPQKDVQEDIGEYYAAKKRKADKLSGELAKLKKQLKNSPENKQLQKKVKDTEERLEAARYTGD